NWPRCPWPTHPPCLAPATPDTMAARPADRPAWAVQPELAYQTPRQWPPRPGRLRRQPPRERDRRRARRLTLFARSRPPPRPTLAPHQVIWLAADGRVLTGMKVNIWEVN